MPRIPITKAVDLEQLQAQLQAAGISAPGLGTDSGGLFTYGPNGQPVDLPETAAAVVTAHTPEPREAAVAREDLSTQYTAAANRLDAIVADGAAYTAPQVRDAVVDMARIQRRLLRLVKVSLT